MSGAGVGRGTRRERGRREVWGRVPRDWETDGIGRRGASRFGGRKGRGAEECTGTRA